MLMPMVNFTNYISYVTRNDFSNYYDPVYVHTASDGWSEFGSTELKN